MCNRTCSALTHWEKRAGSETLALARRAGRNGRERRAEWRFTAGYAGENKLLSGHRLSASKLLACHGSTVLRYHLP